MLGICGGYQMLAEEIVDDVESRAGVVAGLGLLPARVRFAATKTLGRPHGEALGEPVAGYEIHHGIADAEGGVPLPRRLRRRRRAGHLLARHLRERRLPARLPGQVAAEAGRAFAPPGAGASPPSARRGSRCSATSSPSTSTVPRCSASCTAVRPPACPSSRPAPPARGQPRTEPAGGSAARIAATGAGRPVMSRTCSTAWWSSTASPPTTVHPAAAADAASGVGQPA